MSDIRIKIHGRSCKVAFCPVENGVHPNREIDRIVRFHTAFRDFEDLVSDRHGTYRPSVYMGGKSRTYREELLELTLRYDAFMQKKGDDRRVFKGDWEIAPAGPQPRIKQTVWGNWYGYLGSKKVTHFNYDLDGSQEQNARRWLANQMTPQLPELV